MPNIYHFRLVLRDISPVIWRRILVRSDAAIARLVAVIQATLGWSDSSLHRFVIHGKGSGVARPDGFGFADDLHPVLLVYSRLHAGESFRSVYNSTDGWVLEFLEQQSAVIFVD